MRTPKQLVTTVYKRSYVVRSHTDRQAQDTESWLMAEGHTQSHIPMGSLARLPAQLAGGRRQMN